MKSVEVRPAHEFTCEECGRDSYVTSMVLDFTDDELLEHLREIGAIEDWETEAPEEFRDGEFRLYPQQVQCPYCEEIFRVADAVGDDGEYDGGNESGGDPGDIGEG